MEYLGERLTSHPPSGKQTGENFLGQEMKGGEERGGAFNALFRNKKGL